MAQDAARRIQEHDYQAAQQLLDRVLAMDPDCHRALDARSLLAACTGKEAEAREMRTAWSKPSPRSPASTGPRMGRQRPARLAEGTAPVLQ
jgi:Tfp pilus assembly protein PilF